METNSSQQKPLCLVTGATGYIGGRLVSQLLKAGYQVRVMARFPDRLRDLPWYQSVEVVQADALDPATMRTALAGVDVAYYLLHAINQGQNFGSIETAMANIFADVAKEQKVKRIIYLGGIIPEQKLSEHLKSRAVTGEILRASGVPTIELRAGVVLGSGSASFEMLRYLTERLPIMVTPKWVNTRIQPIAVRDVLHYLVGAVSIKEDLNRTFDIGGPDVFTYKEMMNHYAKVAQLRERVIITVPLLTPRLSSLWVGFVTPVPGAIARPLVRSLINEVICSESDIKNYIPDPADGLTSFDKAVDLALTRVKEAQVTTRWSSASVPGAPAEPMPSDPEWAGGTLYRDIQKIEIEASPEQLWEVVEGIGGEHGYFSLDWAWEIRGLLDRVVGGVGLRRGRRDADHLHVGEALDFWRVEAREPSELLRLRAEMKMPGLAWLEFQIKPLSPTKTQLIQQAIFYPRGLAGHAYWWSVAPFHVLVFKGMIKNIGKKAQSLSRA
ncbi:MAG: SDR family oxidoreductase [Candidatus Nanopelagicales bacterium]